MCLSPTINKIEINIQIKITGGIGRPKNFPFNEAKFFNQSGTTPKTVPPVTVGSDTNICTPPTTMKPTPSVTISDCPWRLKLIKPLKSPTIVPKARITINASQGGTPSEISDINPKLVAPIKNGIDKSRPPNITTNVCPIVAIPKKEAKTNIDLIFCNDKKPSIETDPIIKRPTSTATPIITLLLMFKNL